MSAAIATRAADLIESAHWAASSLRSAFSFATYGGGAYPHQIGGGYADIGALMAFERHWIGDRQHLNDGTLASATAADMAARVGAGATVAALRAYAAQVAA